jgi:hypothetical protein
MIKMHNFSTGSKIVLQNDAIPDITEIGFISYIIGNDFDFINAINCLVIFRIKNQNHFRIEKRDMPLINIENNAFKNIINPVKENDFWNITKVYSMPHNIFEWDNFDFALWVISTVVFLNNIHSYWKNPNLKAVYNPKNFAAIFNTVMGDITHGKIANISSYSEPYRHKIISDLRKAETFFAGGIKKYINKINNIKTHVCISLCNMIDDGYIQHVKKDQLMLDVSDSFESLLHNYRIRG